MIEQLDEYVNFSSPLARQVAASESSQQAADDDAALSLPSL